MLRSPLNGGKSGQDDSASPAERVSREFELPAAETATWQNVRLTNLEEVPLERLTPDSDGSIAICLTAKQVATVEFKR